MLTVTCNHTQAIFKWFHSQLLEGVNKFLNAHPIAVSVGKVICPILARTPSVLCDPLVYTSLQVHLFITWAYVWCKILKGSILFK